MAANEVSCPAPTNEDLRIAAKQHEYANRAAVGGNQDIAVQCLLTSCRLVPANLPYRQALRKAQRSKYNNNLYGSLLAPLTTLLSRLRLWMAASRRNHRKVLEHGEAILARNPWDKGAQLHMANAALALGLPVLAVWILQQARESNTNDVAINRALARLLEQQGHFTQAIGLWELIRKAAPHDVEARDKAKQLAASETIARGNYEEAATAEQTPIDKPGPLPAPDKSKASPVKNRTAPSPAESIRARLEAHPANPDLYLQLAALHKRNDKLDKARDALEQGLEATGRAVELVLALEDLEIEPLRRSLAQAEEHLRGKPNDKKLQKMRDELLAQVNARELGNYRQRAERDPLDKSNRFEYGVRLLRAGQIEEAICELQAARSDARLQWKTLLNLGYCFQARQNWPLARRNFEEAMRTLPNGEEALRKELLFHLARGHAAAGDLPHAIELALDLANLDYGYQNIGRLLDEWQNQLTAPQPVKPTRK